MPPTKEKKGKKKSNVPAKKKKAAPEKKTNDSKPSVRRDLAIAIVSGVIFGFSAPGIDQWYLGWFGLVPLLLLTVSSNGLGQAFLRGLVFALGYDLVYANWLLHLHPLDWMGFSAVESMAVSGLAWFAGALHQAVITALVVTIIRAIPMTGGFAPRQVEEHWKAPSLLVIPLLWVVLQNKIFNAHDWLGVPWPMIEYSQYKVLPILQITSWIGGIGLSFLMVMVNCALAGLIATLSEHLNFKALAYPTKTSALAHNLAVGICVLACAAFGYARLADAKEAQNQQSSCPLSVVQGNINIEMQKNGSQRYTLTDLIQLYGKMVRTTPAGICVWTESALPTYLKQERDTLDALAELSKDGKREMIIGSIDSDDGLPYNSAFGITSGGKLLSSVYHKRYLVPFGEYMPSWCKYLPSWVQRLTSTPAGVGFTPGKFPVVIDLSGHRIAPLICFETVSPELVVTSVRNGGDLLVNLSDFAWFHDSMCGDQMLAFAVLRAVESGRDFVFAANTGPSALIDCYGRVTHRSASGKALVLNGKVTFRTDRTPFVEWFN